jgi:hypothetical protein
MADAETRAQELYYRATYERRMDACLDALDSIGSNVDHARRDIDRGRIPRLRFILDEALKLQRNIEALEAMAEMKKAFDPAPAPDTAEEAPS